MGSGRTILPPALRADAADGCEVAEAAVARQGDRSVRRLQESGFLDTEA